MRILEAIGIKETEVTETGDALMEVLKNTIEMKSKMVIPSMLILQRTEPTRKL